MSDGPALGIRPLSAALGARIDGIDARAELDADTVRAIRAAWLRFGLLVFRGQALDPPRLVAFTRRFGEPVVYTRACNACDGQPEVLVLSNVVKDGKPIGAALSGRYWHTDGHYLACPPAGTLLFGAEIPAVGGDTHFVNMTAAYRALPAWVRTQIDGRTFVMDRVQTLPFHYPQRPAPPPDQKQAWPDMPQPVVRTHPETGENALYIGGVVPWRIVGMEQRLSDALMAHLHAIAFDEARFGYRHRWRAGDLLMWDNRCLAHRATDYDMVRHRRTMYRTTIAGDRPRYVRGAAQPGFRRPRSDIRRRIPASAQPAVIALDGPEMRRIVEHDSQAPRVLPQRTLDVGEHGAEDVAMKRIVEVQHRRRAGQAKAPGVAMQQADAAAIGVGQRAADVRLRGAMQPIGGLDADQRAKRKACGDDDRAPHAGAVIDEHVVGRDVQVAQHAAECADRARVVVVAAVPFGDERFDRYEAAAADAQAPFERRVAQPIERDARREAGAAPAPRACEAASLSRQIADRILEHRTRP